MQAERIFHLEAEFLKALAHPTRVRILELLRDGEKCVCEFTEDLDLEQANISQHLAVLKKQDIVTSRKEGLRMMYQVNYPDVYAILDVVRRILVSQADATVALLKVVKREEKGGK